MSIFNRKPINIETAYKKYADILYRVALAHLAIDADAQDVVQDVFIKYMSSAPVFNNDAHERAWLLRVTVNRCHDVTRYLKVRESVPIEDAIGIAAPEKGEVPELLELISRIPTKYKEALILHCLEGFSQQETAKILGISLSAVKMRILRGREIFEKMRQEDRDVQ